eukprot:COSAG02_NODE_5595_length_4200_cov_8.320540_3_plen_273_part_00
MLVCEKHAAQLSKALSKKPIRHTIDWRAFVAEVYPVLMTRFADDADSYDAKTDHRDEKARSDATCAVLRSMALWGCLGVKYAREFDNIEAEFNRYHTSLATAAAIMLDAISPTSATSNSSETLTSCTPERVSCNQQGDNEKLNQPQGPQGAHQNAKSISTYDCRITANARVRVRPEVIKYVCTAIINRTPQRTMKALFTAAQRANGFRVINFPTETWIRDAHDALAYLCQAKKGADLIKAGRLGQAICLQMDGGTIGGTGPDCTLTNARAGV